ncbi:hypothetical protein Q9Q60_01580, partial [Campylobacter upsaliensis]|nr:hypothetical protein [Campylobacter upsaliensis]
MKGYLCKNILSTLLRGGGGDTMLSYNQQGIQSRLIPSFLALSVITALHSPLQAAWTINDSDNNQRTEHIDATISSNITLNNRNTAIYTNNNDAIGTLTINEGVTIQVNRSGGKGIEINTGRSGTSVNNITNNGHIDTRGTGIAINDRSSAETITIGANGSITSAGGNAIYVGNSSRVNHIDIQGATTGSGGIINRGTIGVNGTSQPNGIKVTGSIVSNNNRAVALTNHGTIHGGINIENGGTLTGGRQGVNNALYVAIHNNGGTINGDIKVGEGSILNGGIMNYASYYGGFSRLNGNIEVAGTINGTNIGIQNSFGTISGDVKITDKGKVTSNIWNQGTIEGKIEIKGKVDGLIANRPTGVIKKDIEVSGGTITNNISNWGTIEAGIKVENGANITGDIYNEKTIQNGINIANSQIGGNIVNSGQNANTGNISITGTSDIKGSIVNQNGATFNNQITLDQSSKLGGITNAANSTMIGTLTLNGEVGTITNAGKFDSTLTLGNKVGEINNAEGGTISNDITINQNGSVGTLANAGTMTNITNNGTLSNINNSGTMQAITNNGTGTLTLTNSGGTINKVTNGTGATSTIRNQGTITNGIINDGGTLTVFNDFRKDESAANGYHTIGEIGKTANGVHIENKNNGKLNIPIWYFNKEDYATP